MVQGGTEFDARSERFREKHKGIKSETRRKWTK